MSNDTTRPRTGYIYGLFDSRQPLLLWECRYIGLTVKTPERRLDTHVRESRWPSASPNNRRLKWIRSVLAAGGEIVIKVFEVHQRPESELDTLLKARERAWIAEGKHQGWRLVNGTDGGDGTLGRAHSDETKAKIGAKSKGRFPSADTRAKLSEARKGNKNALGLRHTEESRRKMSESHLARGPANSKLVADDVREIRKMLADGIKRREIATKFAVGIHVIASIDRGENWTHVQ